MFWVLCFLAGRHYPDDATGLRTVPLNYLTPGLDDLRPELLSLLLCVWITQISHQIPDSGSIDLGVLMLLVHGLYLEYWGKRSSHLQVWQRSSARRASHGVHGGEEHATFKGSSDAPAPGLGVWRGTVTQGAAQKPNSGIIPVVWPLSSMFWPPQRGCERPNII